jgi:hypothetical protein
MADKSPGLSLAAQPALLAKRVRKTFSSFDMVTSFRATIATISARSVMVSMIGQ